MTDAPSPGAPHQQAPKPVPAQPYPPRVNPDRNEYCEGCHKWGHRPENCGGPMTCDRCGRQGHPARVCEAKPCLKCDEFHQGRCEDWKALHEIKKLLRQGGLADLPSHIRENILNVYVGPEFRALNQDNQQCMSSRIEERVVPPERNFVDCSGLPVSVGPEEPAELKLVPGERYGWWAGSDSKGEGQQVAMVHGAVNNLRTEILLDTGATELFRATSRR
ncbi:hypothetical protein ON010_g2006 [Phytophthora cinnamomi]|nr:hypothetical protein ON010_g2006 [Phytophthora cinnamomi]